MSKGHGLLLFTNVYPFDKGEEFLENEIGALAQAFDRVVVIACQTDSGARLTRPLPDGVTALHVDGRRPTAKGQAARVTSVGAGWLARGAFRAIDPVTDPRHMIMDFQFEGRARAALAQLRPQLERMGLDELADVAVCAYWLHIPARVAMLFAEGLRRRMPQLEVTRMVSRAHRYDLYEGAAPLGHIPLRNALLTSLDAVYPVSDDGTQYLRSRYPAHAEKISTRRLGTADPGQRVAASREPFRVVSCSFTLPVKRLDRFAEVLRLVRDTGVDVRWTHYGSGDELDELRSRAEQVLGAINVDMPGYVRNVEIPERYRNLRPSVFMNLSASEGLPVSIMEASALGLPIVATDVGGVREIVQDGRNGRLLPADFTDHQGAEALLSIAQQDEANFARLCDESRRVWEQSFAMDTVYPAFAAELLG